MARLPDGIPTTLDSGEIVKDMERRTAARVRRFQNNFARAPKLAIILANPDDEPSQRYVGYKQAAGEKLGIEVVVERDAIDPTDILAEIERYNRSQTTDGMVLQLPLTDKAKPYTDQLVAAIAPRKDIDGLGPRAMHTGATPKAAISVVEAYCSDFLERPITVAGLGRLLGAPVLRQLIDIGAQDIQAFDLTTNPLDRVAMLNQAAIIISGMGQAGILTPDLFESSEPRMLVDCGTAEGNGALRGDVSDELRTFAAENGWPTTPKIGGVGRATVHTLLGNLMDVAEMRYPFMEQGAMHIGANYDSLTLQPL